MFAGLTDNFLLRGCARGDVGTLGTDLTRFVYVTIPGVAPKQNGNAKSTYTACKSNALSTQAFAWVAGNGGCDHNNVCTGPNSCEVLALSWNKQLQPSESEDTFIRLQNFKSSGYNEPCIKLDGGKQPDGTEAVIPCTGNTKSNDNTASYGGFDFYGDRFSCWRNMGGSVRPNTAAQMTASDLIYKTSSLLLRNS